MKAYADLFCAPMMRVREGSEITRDASLPSCYPVTTPKFFLVYFPSVLSPTRECGGERSPHPGTDHLQIDHTDHLETFPTSSMI